MLGCFSRADRSNKSALEGEEMEKLVPVKSKGWHKHGGWGMGVWEAFREKSAPPLVLSERWCKDTAEDIFLLKPSCGRRTDNEKGKLRL